MNLNAGPVNDRNGFTDTETQPHGVRFTPLTSLAGLSDPH